MSIKQGFKSSDGAIYVYQENTDTGSISSSMGIAASSSVWVMNVSSSANAQPGVGFQPISINPATGVILFTPGGGGSVQINGPLSVTGGISYTGDIITLNAAVSSVANSVIFEKSRAGAVIVTGDDLGQVYFKGFDGTAYVTGASIRADSSGTIAANRVAGSLIFATHPDSASGLTPTDQMTIAPTGVVTLTNLALRGVVQTNASGALSTTAGTNGQILISDTATGTPTWATITAGAGITVTNGANSITLAASGFGFTWNTVAGTSATMAVENGYIPNNAGLVTLTLPAVAAIGDSIIVTGKGAGGWLIAQNAGQTIFFGASTTTTGVTGSLASTNRRDSIELVCVTANNDWNAIASIGNITVV